MVTASRRPGTPRQSRRCQTTWRQTTCRPSRRHQSRRYRTTRRLSRRYSTRRLSKRRPSARGQARRGLATPVSMRPWPGLAISTGCQSTSTQRYSSMCTGTSRRRSGRWTPPRKTRPPRQALVELQPAPLRREAEQRAGHCMGTRRRLDAELVRRGLARSREHAAELVTVGRVLVAGQVAGKPATQVAPDDSIAIRELPGMPDYASRGGRKLAGALAAFPGLMVAGRRCLDAGASTGGFTDVLLRAGAAHVVAVDVGYGQLAWALRSDPRVTVLDRVNVRQLTPEQVAPAPGLVTADLSFISLALVLPALAACAAADADFLLLVKPQFEVGKGKVGAGGVVRDPAQRAEAVAAVAAAAQEIGLGTAGIVASPLPGPSGNVEYFLWLHRAAPPRGPAALPRALIEWAR